MASRPNVKTKALTRDVLADVAKGNPRAIKALEDLSSDVQTTLPDAIEAITESSESVLIASMFAPRVTPPTPKTGGSADTDGILATGAFLRRSPSTTTIGDAANSDSILASQIFGA